MLHCAGVMSQTRVLIAASSRLLTLFPGQSAPCSCSNTDILTDLTRKDLALYTHNGLINMLNRNVKVKTAPGAPAFVCGDHLLNTADT